MDDSAAATTATRLPATSLNRSSFQLLPNQNQNGTTTPTKSLLNLDTLSLKSSSYTSLQDVLPFTAAATVNSPTASSATHEISIRNRLVKQAAWAYLQPISPSPSSPSGPQFLHHLRQTLSSDSRSRRRRNPLTACLSFVSHVVPCFTRVLHRILHAIWTQGD